MNGGPPFPTHRRAEVMVSGFTLVELVVSMAASTIVLGGLMLSSLAMQRSLTGSEKYAVAYSDQRRLTDFIARDLRRAVAMAATDAAGVRAPLTAGTVNVNDRATLILSLPGYYRSNVKSTADFDQPLDVVGTAERLDYGTPAGPAALVEVSFRKVFVIRENCTCFVRQEEGIEDVIVRAADNLSVEVNVLTGAQSASIRAWFPAPYSAAGPPVSTYDHLLLRNPPLDLHP